MARVNRGRKWQDLGPAVRPPAPDGLEGWRKERERESNRRRVTDPGYRERKRLREKQARYLDRNAARVRRFRSARIIGSAETIPMGLV